MTVYILHAEITSAVTYRVHADSLTEALALFHDGELPDGEYMDGDARLVGATLDGGAELDRADRLSAAVYASAPHDTRAVNAGVTLGCCG